MARPTFEVDKEGLRKILERRGKEFAVVELIQNAWDEASTRVDIDLHKSGRQEYRLTVIDDNPEGFKDLAHAYTLFAESEKKSNPEQRGRFNLGEKLVIALCKEAMISTTKGIIHFDHRGRTHGRTKRPSGTEFQGVMRMTGAEFERTEEVIQSLIPPIGIDTYFNGALIPHRKPITSFMEALPTEISDTEGYLRPTVRQTMVNVYEPREGEIAMLYEMGIPVVETEDTFHVNVMQKVPLNTDRDNVTPSYLRKVRTLVLNRTVHFLNSDATELWVGEALSSPDITDDAVDGVLTRRFGTKRVIYDPSDPEGTKIAVSKGYTVIPPRSFNASQWANIKAAGAALPAGQVTPSPKPFHEGGRPLKVLTQEQWTDDMWTTVDFAKAIGSLLLGFTPTVVIANDIKWPFGGSFGTDGILHLNVGRLGHKWFGDPTPAQVKLLIHEFAHYKVSDHLSNEFHNECCRLGAKLFFLTAMSRRSEAQYIRSVLQTPTTEPV